ncbi:protein of unknown function [Bradyrhizobium sp. ORS 285]|uniref:hypothetical protein n=1 Tax=Bradyrhizobium sp. ORS 285 TaxID=115808 RepID=UPI0002409023|nr:hypothetical protein [Bradyrhizobium sp. ORS 285]CCD89831.1 hypothetical protein BRAO285_850033 [Bradyrhizobium sp. ORS 285]SMX61539.1 protein of unknown function [Bradyrhizobium sp. ORS 285]
MAKKKAAKKKRKTVVTETDLSRASEEIVAEEPKPRRGRPPIYEKEEDFTAMFFEYVDRCKETKEMPNKAGMRYFLRISADTWNVYREKFPEAHKEAEDFIEQAWVQRLAGTTPTGAIFYLKNAFWQDYKDSHQGDLTLRPASLTKDDIGAAIDKLPEKERDALYVQIANAITGGSTGSAA